MAYWVDDKFGTWPEVFRAGTAAAGLYVRCGAYCAANTTDGHIPSEVATGWGTREWIHKLVEVGLWEIEETGYRDVYYLVAPDGSKLNPAKAEVVKRREQAKARQAKHRKGNPNPVTRDNRVTNTSRDALPTLPPSLPPPLKRGRGARKSRGEKISNPSTGDDSQPSVHHATQTRQHAQRNAPPSSEQHSPAANAPHRTNLHPSSASSRSSPTSRPNRSKQREHMAQR